MYDSSKKRNDSHMKHTLWFTLSLGIGRYFSKPIIVIMICVQKQLRFENFPISIRILWNLRISYRDNILYANKNWNENCIAYTYQHSYRTSCKLSCIINPQYLVLLIFDQTNLCLPTIVGVFLSWHILLSLAKVEIDDKMLSSFW